MGKILEIPLVKRRQRFTQEQTKAIQERFSAEIEAKAIPSGEAIDQFLVVENKDLFSGRKHGDIYSKVRNSIGHK